MRQYGWLAACAAALVCLDVPAGMAAQAETQARYWYDGTTRMPLYRQPQLDRAASGRATKPGTARHSESFQAEGNRSGGADGTALPVYSTDQDPGRARLMTQAPGVLFTLADSMSPDPVRTWLAARGLRAEPVAGGTAFKVSSVAGEQALDLANALYESGLVEYAQPNWVLEVDPQLPPYRR